MALVTIHGEHPWAYIDLLNECIKILLTVAVGILCGYRKVIDTSSFVPQAVRFVFQVALPCHIAKGIGIGVDFYDDAFLWDYIFAFLVLRAIALVVAFAIVFFQPRRDKESWNGIGQVAILWLNMTWLSTIILGIPIAQAVFNDARKGAFYGLVRSKEFHHNLVHPTCSSSYHSILTLSTQSWPVFRLSSFNCRFNFSSWNATSWSKKCFSPVRLKEAANTQISRCP